MRAAAVVALFAAGCAAEIVVVAPPEAPPAESPVAVEEAPAVAAPVEDAPPVAAVAATPEPAPPQPAAPIVEPPSPPATRGATTCVFENSEPWPRPNPGSLGTTSYPPSAAEKPFHDKVFGAKQGGRPGTSASMSMPRDVGKDVAWFGVVRGISVDPERRETRLLLENKYFDGLTDTHILCVSFAGGGDFVAILPCDEMPVRPLALVRVYGRVVSVKDDVPRVAVEYVRQFDQGTYCFMFVNGKPAGNQSWRKLCTVADDDVYSPFPKPSYYEARIGRREDFAPGKVDVPRD